MVRVRKVPSVLLSIPDHPYCKSDDRKHRRVSFGLVISFAQGPCLVAGPLISTSTASSAPRCRCGTSYADALEKTGTYSLLS